MFDINNVLGWLGDDIIEREQYLDFLCFRRFRQTLLCHAELPLERPAAPDRMDRFLFSSPARKLEGQIQGLNAITITEPPDDVARVAAAMGEIYPLPVPFDKLLQCIPDRDALRRILFALISSGFAQFHIHDFVAGQGLPPQPRASRLARWENARGNVVTYSNHSALKLDSMVRALLELSDGTRGVDELATGLAELEDAPPVDEIRSQLPHILLHMARTGLLER
jgi:hypothetical protein